MPLYEYRCETCGAKEELLEGFAAPTQHACPTCSAADGMRRQISAAAFTLAGGGWHAQGYGKGGEAKPGTPGVTPAAATPGQPAAAAPADQPAATPAAPAGGCAGGCGCHSAKP